jgi:serine protease DegS
VGDILVSLDGAACRNAEDVLAILGKARPGQALRAVLVRGGARREVTLMVGERPQRQYCS